MARLFIFAIGGTGSRVLKSLTMLLAAGVKPDSQQEYEIVPIIIDPHRSNDDLKRTERLLTNYQSITDEVGLSNGFFNTKITTLDRLATESGNRLSGSFTFNLQQVAATRFKDYIDFSSLDKPNKAIADILFSGKSINKSGEEIDLLDTEMDIGFVGNPNIGSVVLNQFKDSKEFIEFASNFTDEDRVFIISSIFGGTGAAGFPTVLKNIRDAMNNPKLNSKEFLQNAKIGAITVLPYFNVEKDDKSPIQKSHFIAKAKSALYYYKDNITGNKSVNSLYYITDDHSGKPYKNDPGDHGQQNNAHFIELAAALAVIDFLETPDGDLKCEAGKALTPLYKEFAVKNEAADIKFSDFEDETEKKIGLRLSQLTLFKKFLDEQLSVSLERQPWVLSKPELNGQFFADTFYKTNLTEFLESFAEWLKEMSDNRRGFSPFNLNSSLQTFIKDRTAKEGLFWGKVNYSFYDSELNKESEAKKNTYVSASQKLIDLFFRTTQEILTKKFGLKN